MVINAIVGFLFKRNANPFAASFRLQVCNLEQGFLLFIPLCPDLKDRAKGISFLLRNWLLEWSYGLHIVVCLHCGLP